MQPAIFLDRDNTLIANDGDLGNPDDVRLLEGVAESLLRLSHAGYRLVVVTNQGGVARGRYSEDDVDAVHQRIASLVDQATGEPGLIDRFYYCPYHPEATEIEYRREHPWRKPNPGMLLQASRDLGLDLRGCWMIGDQPRDIAAGRAAGCRTILVHANGKAPADCGQHERAPGIKDAVDIILQRPARPPEELNVQSSRPQIESAADEPKSPSDGDASLKRAIRDLTDELRSERERRSEFTPLRLCAMFCQLGVVLLVLLALLQLQDAAQFYRWLAAAGLAQLFTISLLLLDQR